jgi:serine protease Do
MRSLALVLAVALPASAAPRIIDDVGLMRNFHKKLSELADETKAPSGEELSAALKKAPKRAPAELPDCAGRPDYQKAIEGVVLLGSVFRCEDPEGCKKWHFGPVATAWCASADGLFVTNYHCFEDAEDELHGICTADGRVAAITEIVAGDARSDSCLFRVDGKGFTPLPVGQPAEVGDKVRVISHPEKRFYMQTSGEVARYYKRAGRGPRAGAPWMNITADFARGSSGGPVLNESGAVVGMVSSTQSIYYGTRKKDDDGKGPLQMVVKTCVTGQALRDLLGR